MSPQDKLIDKLRKLKNMAEGAEKIGSEAEAQAFAAMFQKILLENKLEMTDIEFDQFEAEQPVETHRIDYTQYPDIKLKKTRQGWLEALAEVIANAHFCRVLVYPGSSRISLLGRKDDCLVAEYMLITLQRAVERMADKEYAAFSTQCVKECAICGRQKNNHGVDENDSYVIRLLDGHKFTPNWAKCRGFRPAFITAFIIRLYERYQEERRARERESTALIRLNRAEEGIIKYFKEKKIKMAGALGDLDASNREGIKRGQKAADDIQLRANALSANDSKRKEIG